MIILSSTTSSGILWSWYYNRRNAHPLAISRQELEKRDIRTSTKPGTLALVLLLRTPSWSNAGWRLPGFVQNFQRTITLIGVAAFRTEYTARIVVGKYCCALGPLSVGGRTSRCVKNAFDVSILEFSIGHARFSETTRRTMREGLLGAAGGC